MEHDMHTHYLREDMVPSNERNAEKKKDFRVVMNETLGKALQ
jgi:hypothetical protein